ncbi:hypothetical protein [Streptomyces sp. SGAir0957]
MTERLSPQRETEIRERAEAATPGPWKVENDYCDCSEYGCSHPPFAVAFGPFTSFENTTDRHHYDADFSGHAREDVPALLAELAAVRAERDEARAELAKYVGSEPTVAEEMAHLNRCLNDVHAVCDGAEEESLRWENPLPVPEWVAVVRKAAEGARPEREQVVEYGIRVPAIRWPKDGVLLDGGTFDRADQESRLARYRDCWPNAELVQRTVRRGEWKEAAS